MKSVTMLLEASLLVGNAQYRRGRPPRWKRSGLFPLHAVVSMCSQGMNELVARTLQFIRLHGLLERGEEVLVGLSGGPDSVALALVLLELSRCGALPLRIRLAHLNHCLRGAESDADEEFCRRFAARHSLPIETARVAVREAVRRGESLEETARRVRYRFLTQLARQQRVRSVVLGHQADDVAETVVMRLLRGCGLRGLGALPPERPAGGGEDGVRIVRPLLELQKADLLEFLCRRGEPYRVDSSNRRLEFQRNRIRHDLLPVLKRCCPGFAPASLCALNRAAVELNALLDEMLDRRWNALCVEARPDAVGLDAGHYRRLPPPLRKRAVRRALKQLLPGPHSQPGLTRKHYDEAAELADRPVGAAIALPGGLLARREHGLLYISRPSAGSCARSARLEVPGTTVVDWAGLTLRTEALPAQRLDNATRQAGPHEAFLSLEALSMPLSVRRRRPGDRFHPLGAPGGRKLKEFFIDRKVPRHQRDRTALLVDAAGRIAWVVGHEIAEPFKLTGARERILHLVASRPDAAG